jgi:hypothetical protein
MVEGSDRRRPGYPKDAYPTPLSNAKTEWVSVQAGIALPSFCPVLLLGVIVKAIATTGLTSQ